VSNLQPREAAANDKNKFSAKPLKTKQENDQKTKDSSMPVRLDD